MHLKDKGGLDSLDLELIRLLEDNAQRSSTELAKQLHSSAATIRRRIRRLIRSKTIYIVAIPNPNKFGLLLNVVIGLKTQNNRVDSVVQMLFDRPEIMWIASTTGRFNVLFGARFSNNDDLARFLKVELPKLEQTIVSETLICLEMLVKTR